MSRYEDELLKRDPSTLNLDELADLAFGPMAGEHDDEADTDRRAAS